MDWADNAAWLRHDSPHLKRIFKYEPRPSRIVSITSGNHVRPDQADNERRVLSITVSSPSVVTELARGLDVLVVQRKYSC